MNDPRGALWRVWDLHVHTPDSIVQNYGRKCDETWDKFLDAIEALPSHIRVIGISDYIFLDGYKRLLSEKKKGRLKNIDLLLPVVELRLDKFGGTDSALSRVNYHVIFSEELSADTIEQQFINALPRSYKLSPEHEGLFLEWSGVLTKASLEDLGRKLIASVPETEKAKFQSPLVEGFNNLNVCLDSVLEVLSSSYFKGKCITAVGKTEWWNIKWNDKSIADKKNIINSAGLVFIAAGDSHDYLKAKESLSKAAVNSKLLDCSDAHNFSSSPEKDRLGRCLTWLKADPTFQGLKHVILEPDERIFVGDIPPQDENVKNNPTYYIRSVKIRRDSAARKNFTEKWFDVDIKFNSGLVAIIGNKGSGKSALVDVMGLLGNSYAQEGFSFLNKDKFKREPENKARNFLSILTWESEKEKEARLDDDISRKNPQKIKYIPQNYFERICTQLPGTEDSEFDKELRAAIFSHVSDAARLRMPSLDDLIAYRSNEIDDAIRQMRERLQKTNKNIARCECMLEPDYKATLQNRLQARKEELIQHRKLRPAKVRKPAEQSAAKSETLSKAETKKKSLEKRIESSREELKDVSDKIAKIKKARDKLNNLQDEVESVLDALSDVLSELGISSEELVSFTIVTDPLDNLEQKLFGRKSKLESQLSLKNPNGLLAKLDEAKKRLTSLHKQLDKPGEKYEAYKEKLAQWQTRKQEIQGDKKAPGTVAYFEEQIADLARLPQRLEILYERRRQEFKAIHSSLRKQKAVLQELYTPVQEFITEHPDIGKKIELNFGVSITETGFADRLVDFINFTKTGAFMGAIEGKQLANELAGRVDFNDDQQSISFAESIAERIRCDPKSGQIKNVASQLKKGKSVEELYDLLFSLNYLSPRYVLKMGEKELRQLSPGERGALLIVFYLLVDLETIPLVIDQPELNLDNETVTKLLVPAIRKAKKRRQIVIVTHNPILAVVCNADQVIVASLDIKDGYKVKYFSGAIENPLVNKRIVDILEGTMPAFDNRHRKYIREYLEAYESVAWK